MMRKSGNLWIAGGIWLIPVIFIISIPVIAGADNLSVAVSVDNYQIVSDGEGQRIVLDNSGRLAEPGKPLLPAINYLIALPPGAIVRSVDISDLGATDLPENYNIKPSPPVLPLVNPDLNPEFIDEINRQWRQSYESVYFSDHAYPAERGRLAGSGSLRKYAYASVLYYPFSYYPKSGRLRFHSRAEITVSYDLPIPGSPEARRVEELKWDKIADERAAELFVNYDQIEPYYHIDEPRTEEPLNIYNYVIITNQGLVSAINTSEFINWKTSLGYIVRTVATADPEITGQPGTDLAAKIRNFLINYYGTWGIEYVLLVGDYSAVPMRYCYPDPGNHAYGAGDPSNWSWAGEVPTDFYYADLSSVDDQSWDSDGDGYRGEYGQDNPDLLAEVYVGRIPTCYPDRIIYTLNKLVTFEQDTGGWKENILQAGAIAYYQNDDYTGRDLMDGAVLLNRMENELMPGMSISHYSEQDGLAPSAILWPGLSEASFIGDWRNGQYGIVNWYAHGWSNGVSRKVWSWDDGDGVPESFEMTWPRMIGTDSNLDDDHPSIVFALSCLVGYPEPNVYGNLGIDLLTKPSFGASAGIVSGTRLVWVSTGGGELHSYEFSHNLINYPFEPKKVGKALYDAKFYLSQNYYWNHYAEYWDTFTFNLYGDPALKHTGAVATGIDESLSSTPNRIEMSQNYPNPFNAQTTFNFILPEAGIVQLTIYDLLGRQVKTLLDEFRQAGTHTIILDASGFTSGIYFYRLQVGEMVETRRMVLLK